MLLDGFKEGRILIGMKFNMLGLWQFCFFYLQTTNLVPHFFYIQNQLQYDYQYMMIRFVGLLLIVVVSTLNVYPPPKTTKMTGKHLLIQKQCPNIRVKDSAFDGWQYYFDKILKRSNNEQCTVAQVKESYLPISIEKNAQIPKEGYKLNIAQQGIKIQTSSYEGYVYAMETLYQLINRHENRLEIGEIEDEPLVEYRGILIDSARHFLSFAHVKRMIESMPISKLNILHWHMADDQSFPVHLKTHPELVEGAYTSSETYSLDQLKQLIQTAKNNAVSIIPQFDTPAHVRSWGLSQKWKKQNITILCPKGEGYNHQFDLSKSQTYQLAQDVIKEVDDLFRQSPYIHLGGDEVFSDCWDLRPDIQKFMKQKNIHGYGQLVMYWRYQLKQVLPSSRKVIFWRNNAENVTLGSDDILHYWGSQGDVAKVVKDSSNKIILSPSDLLYLNEGFSFIWQNATFGTFRNWLQVYRNFIVFPEGVDRSRILGAEVCAWGQVINEDLLENIVWLRASAFAGKVWSSEKSSISEMVAHLMFIRNQLWKLGVDPSPATSEYCEMYPEVCYPVGMETDPTMFTREYCSMHPQACPQYDRIKQQ